MELDIGSGFAIRSFTSGDAESIVKYADNRRVSMQLRDMFPYPYTLKDAHDWLKIAMNEEPERNFAIASPDEVTGGIGIGLWPGERRVSGEIGYWLGEPYWGRGIATRAVKAFTEYVFEEYDLLRVYAEVFSSNPASARVLEKAGYTLVGRFSNAIIKEGKILDLSVYERLRSVSGKP